MPFRLFLLAGFCVTLGGCGDAASARCFLPEATPPTRQEVLADRNLGQSARDLADALLDGDLTRADNLLRADSALARTRVGQHHDMLTVALASCSPKAVELVLHHGARPDGDGKGVPLGLALMATDPALAQALLKGGASVTPPDNPLGPFRTAIMVGSLGAVRLLVDHRGDVNVADRLGHRPLLIALDTERFTIAEFLLDHGADPWAIDSGGGNLGTAAYTTMVTTDANEAEAQRRLRTRLSRLGWPGPPPAPAEIRAAAVAGKWPPPGVKASPLPAELRKIIADNAR